MKLGIMQPYVFPYIGYFHLIQAVDQFVFYDDVNFMKQGWVNRNRILNNNAPFTFTIPLENASSFSRINDIQVSKKLFDIWVVKFLKNLEMNYRKAPYFEQVMPVITETLKNHDYQISEIAKNSILNICNFIGLHKTIIPSSCIFENDYLSGKDRVIDICKKTTAGHYINAIGGRELYDKTLFAENGLQLNFVKTGEVTYKQFKNEFVPRLSIIDVLMFNGKDDISHLLLNFELV